MALPSINNVDLKLLDVFRTIARCGGFSLAQAELNVSQATISIHVKNLETRLGLTLCQRGRSGFALTEDGQRVYDASNALFNHIEDFRSLVLGYEQLVGELQIAMIDNSVFHPRFQLGNVIKRFGELDHQVDITVHVGPPNQLETMVLSGQAHIGVGYFPRRISQLDYEPLYMSEMRLFCGQGHPLFEKEGKDITVQDVEMYPHAQRGYVSFDQLPENERSFTYSARAPNIEGLAHLVLSGQYLAFLPIHYAETFVEQGKVRALMTEEYGYVSCYEIIRRKSAARTPAEKKFHELLMLESRELDLVTGDPSTMR
ncbi:LysR family transcriptional regulator [Cognatishimia sp. 1_MG-2023]|uniref:LysR family transcriptional regulator n=1 Tax=Cognatishimia sp. 1_MG-2023 TaxID=3062642 RepID=UPI0026E2EA81|nr:LysR family transcriptional regulator [Cognatishimia sp. 1_MG-2023]MDO6728227.1 LysR family transcriptional regulator [Cognatishimia sp. 1_MG-2023]